MKLGWSTAIAASSAVAMSREELSEAQEWADSGDLGMAYQSLLTSKVEMEHAALYALMWLVGADIV